LCCGMRVSSTTRSHRLRPDHWYTWLGKALCRAVDDGESERMPRPPSAIRPLSRKQSRTPYPSGIYCSLESVDAYVLSQGPTELNVERQGCGDNGDVAFRNVDATTFNHNQLTITTSKQ
jgi:hypothetical protein